MLPLWSLERGRDIQKSLNDIVGLPLEQHFLKRLEWPYVQQLTTMALFILYHGWDANQRGRNSYVNSIPPSPVNKVITTFETIYKEQEA